MNEIHPLPYDEGIRLLDRYGIHSEGYLCEADESAVRTAADACGYPLVLKAHSEHLLHKSDAGGVVLDISDADAALTARRTILDGMHAAGLPATPQFLVQPMAAPGLEILIGARQDPVFGPLTMVGSGGKYVELLADAAPGIGVLTTADAEEMLARTRVGKIIDGYRGATLDKAELLRLIIALSRLMDENPAIREVDLNPVILYRSGYSLVDARILKGPPLPIADRRGVSRKHLDSLKAILNPRSAAIIGASRPGTMGGIILHNCRRLERLYPVNPGRDRLLGLPCYHSIDDLPEAPDMGVFIVNAEQTVRSFRQFCEKGGRGAIILSDGFAEVGRRDLEEELKRTADEFGIAYIGPNCLGAINNFTGLNTFFIPEHRSSVIEQPNGIGIISQSGGIGLEMVEMMKADNLPVGKIVSCGNASGVGVPEILAHLGEDPAITVIAIYLEGIQDGRALMEVGRRVSREKPVLIIKGGTGGGAEATQSHTASLAGSVEAFRACCRQAGLFLIDEFTEDPKVLVNILSLLTSNPPSRGNRAAVVSVGGGAGILLADQITEYNMELARFSDDTRAALQRLLGVREAVSQTFGSNPVDLLGDCDDNRLLGALEIIDNDPNTDVILTAIYLQIPHLSEYLADRLVDLKSRMKKPLVISPRGFGPYTQNSRAYLHSKGIHTYTVPMIKPLSMCMQIWQRYSRSFNTLDTD